MGKSFDGKKLSWAYRKKAKLRRAENLSTNTNNSSNENGQNSRIFVKNLSFKATEEDVKQFYEPFGEIREVNLPKRSDGGLVGCGFIGFKRIEDASRAIFNTDKKEFFGRIIRSHWALSKSKFREEVEKNRAENREKEVNEGDAQSYRDEQEQDNDNDSNNAHQKIRKEKNYLKKQKRRKFQKMKKQKKRARIVIRNLSFKATEDDLREHFSQYGDIQEVKILTRQDGKQVGVAFVQFDIVQNAAKAVRYANMQPLLDRPVIVDWAVSKTKFSQANADVKPEIIEENDVSEEEQEASNSSEDKAEPNCSNMMIENIKTEDESDEEEEIKHEMEDVDEDESDEDSNNDDNNDNDDDSSDSDDDNNVVIDQSVVKEEKESNRSHVKGPSRISNDVSEGKTIFLKNVPFSVKKDELKKYMEQFGPVYYALVCIDPLTEYSKGTAFVKFRQVEDAEKCLLAELRLHDQIMEVHKALHKKDVENKKSLKEQRARDTRNLYLVKEGVVLAGSKAAEQVSASDMEKRLKLERWKSQILRNLNMFVSRVRLVVHNLPNNLDDATLRQLFKNHSGPKAVIKEARVMRDMKNVDATGKGKSKEYGFVAFTTHEDALRALRSINNNPNIFSLHRRPIVGFSIENRIMVDAKERRIEKSRKNNPLWSENKNKRKSEETKEEVPAKRIKARKSNDLEEKSYAGIAAKVGQDNLRSNFKLKSQAAVHTRKVKKQKKLDKAKKQQKIVQREKAKNKRENMPIKQKKKTNTDDFNKLVNNYRNKLKNIDLKKKWYESNES